MSYYDQHQAPPPGYPPQSNPPPPASYPAQPYVAPPPAGYPTQDGATGYPPQQTSETKDRGDGFWKGCCAALCCCCLLDACF